MPMHLLLTCASWKLWLHADCGLPTAEVHNFFVSIWVVSVVSVPDKGEDANENRTKTIQDSFIRISSKVLEGT